MTFDLTVASKPSALTLGPGAAGSVDVTIVNVSDIIEHYDVTIVGLPPEYITSSEPGGPKLKPRQSATVRLTVTLPRRNGIPGGHYALGILVASKYTADVRRSSELALDVESVSALTLTPQPLIAQGRGGARFTVAVSGQGNTPVTVTLVAKDDQGKADFTIQPPSMVVRPGQSMSPPFAVDVRLRELLVGQERRTAITFSAMVDGEIRADVPVSLVQPPLIAAGVIRALGAVAAVLLVVGAIVAGYALNNTDSGLGANPAPTAAGESGKTKSKQPKTQATSGPAIPPTTEETSTSSPPSDASSDSSTRPSPRTAPTVDSEFSVSSASTATGVATCPEGTVVLGGGVEVAARSGVTPGTALMASAPEDVQRPRNWRVSLLDQGTDGATATVGATCAPEPPGYEVVTAELTVAGIGYARASCSDGRVVLGGGAWTAETDPDPDTTLMESRPVEVDGRWSEWLVAVRSTSAESRTGTVYAICATEFSAYAVVPSTPEVTPGETAGLGSVDASAAPTCPEGMRALSGGAGDVDPSVDQSQDPQTTIAQSMLVGGTTEDPVSGWTSLVRGVGAARPSLMVFAVCGNPDAT